MHSGKEKFGSSCLVLLCFQEFLAFSENAAENLDFRKLTLICSSVKTSIIEESK